MKDSLYLNILKTAEKNGIGLKSDVTTCFNKYSLEAESLIKLMSDSQGGRKKEIIQYLNRMIEAGHLISADVQIVKEINEKIKKWDNFEFAVVVILSPEGYKFLQEVKLNKSNINSFIFQIIIAVITTVFIVMTGWVAITDKSEKEINGVSEQIKNLRLAIIPKTSTAKQRFYATDKEVKKVYQDLIRLGYTERNLGNFVTFSKNLQHWVNADIYWQILSKAGYRNYGNKKEFVLKYSKDAPDKLGTDNKL